MTVLFVPQLSLCNCHCASFVVVCFPQFVHTVYNTCVYHLYKINGTHGRVCAGDPHTQDLNMADSDARLTNLKAIMQWSLRQSDSGESNSQPMDPEVSQGYPGPSLFSPATTML